MINGVNSEEIQSNINKLFSSILKEQQKYTAIKAADEDKKHLTEEKLAEYTKNRGKGFFYNYLSSGRGHGPFTELIDGSVKLDLIGGIGPNILGHSHPLYIKAHLEAACSDTIMCGNLQPYQEAANLTNLLISKVQKSKLRNFWYTGSGSFANDLALKLIWQKKDPAYRLIAFTKAFAGRSVATQDITYNASYREGMQTAVNVDHVPHFDQTNPEGSAQRTIDALNEVVKQHPGQHCAIMLELVQGEGGFIFGEKDYYVQIFEWAKAHGLYIWIDEVQTFARTKELFAFQTLGLDEYVDIVTVGKALQCCGTLYSDELNPKPGLIAGTFNGSLTALNAGEKIVRYLTEGNFYGEKGRMAELEHTFISRLKHLGATSCKGKITYAGGIGTMIAFEVGDSSGPVTTKFVKDLFDRGLLVFTAGSAPTRVRMLLPVCLTDEQIDIALKIIEETVIETIN
ncbi:aminotransferase class III-fold pyridoxal phosphate-dependent enzyme [Bacteriovorax sp. Seq25_V]|uniref:aminotransferase class III-fold pyridoxal phosphate-dependent enzyme n=1 Tax=Bacteriovorax sp. Seq25_V TaxID=1201288 RepID=UPI00038A3244|nr:aminotransferase class III-fold pyridoxal phosphate-dependent enzyme [Bacteriovorax sp. Seq25_V]EQC43456.1 aminotransferase, class III [Bacteriovorax sp. Seq25_V]